MRRVVIVPGNGSGCASSNFYPWLAAALRARGHEVVLREMPDADRARRRFWMPFVREMLRGDEGAVLVGHSSGALAGLRVGEEARLHGLILVSATPSDLGDTNERLSGFYEEGTEDSSPWRWAAVRANVEHVALFASTDDPFIPLALQRSVRDSLAAAGAPGASGAFEYVELARRSHFFGEEQPELLAAVSRIAAAPARP